MTQLPAQPALHMHETLRRVFGFDTFRPNQEGIVRAILGGTDVFAVMPTGGGKSLCYQLPACLMEGVCVVVSPLISLMKDQVDAARSNGVRAASWNSSLTAADRSAVSRSLRAGELDLLYVSPERMGLGGFMDLLKTVRICLLAVDEAHCISEWGHDFRPDYLHLSQLAEQFPSVPLAAFTATATHRVQTDIVERLKLRRPHVVRASFDRPNLFYQVEPKDDVERQITNFLRSRKGQSAIVYRTTRDNVKETAGLLQEAGIRALPYHAGMDPKARQQNQDAFSRDVIDVIVATIAFGMGIDKSNVRYVIHGDLPKNLESYYQETGRAGRDGSPAQCLLFFDMADVSTLRYFVNKVADPVERKAASQKLSQMVDFAQSTACRRKQLLGYFGEKYPRARCPACDVCCGPVRIDDGSVDAQKIMSAIARTGECFDAQGVIGIVTGTDSEAIRSRQAHTIKTFGVGKDKGAEHWQRTIDELLLQGHLQAGPEAAALSITSRGKEVLFGRQTFHVLRSAEPDKPARRPEADIAGETAFDPALFEALRRLRRTIAQSENVPPFVVMSDRTLQEIARRIPRTTADLAHIDGIGEAKLNRYGEELVAEVNLFWETETAAGRTPRQFRAPAGRKRKKKSANQSVEVTWALLQEGLSVDEVVSQRGMARSTILGHMETLIIQGKEVDVTPLVSPSDRDELEKLFTVHGTASLGKVLEACNRAYTYDQARMVRALLRKRS